MKINRFYEFLFRCEEFVFFFESCKFEIAYDNKLQLYKYINTKAILVQEFDDCKDFFNNAKLNNKFVKDIYLSINTEF